MGHKVVSVDKLKPGMVLAREIVGSTKHLMAGKGVELTDRMIAHLKRFGIKRAFVEWEKQKEIVDPELAQRQIHEFEAALDSRFQKVAHIPIMKELKAILLNHMKEKILHGQGESTEKD